MTKSKIYYVLTLPFFFPNISFNIFSFDVSPLPLLAALFILITTSKKYPSILYYLWVPSIFSIPFIFTTFGDWPYFFRLIGVYFTAPMVAMACYRAIFVGVAIGKLARDAIYISFIGALTQKFISINFFSYLLQSRSTESRGYNSLFAEPSFFGMATLMFCIIYIASNKIIGTKNSWLPLAVGFISITLLSQSALVILILLVTISLYLLVDLRPKSLALLIFIIILITITSLFIEEGNDSRLMRVTYSILKSPQDILLIDASISERVMHVYLSVKGAAMNYFMPNGFYRFYDSILIEMNENQYFWWGEPSNKIMSGIGSALYEIGFVALITPWILVLLTVRNNFKRGFLIFSIATPIFIYSNAINFASPYFSILIGLLAYGSKKHKYQLLLAQHHSIYAPGIITAVVDKRHAVRFN